MSDPVETKNTPVPRPPQKAAEEETDFAETANGWDEAAPRQRPGKQTGPGAFETNPARILAWDSFLRWVGAASALPMFFFAIALLVWVVKEPPPGAGFLGLALMLALLGWLMRAQFRSHYIFKLPALGLYLAAAGIGYYIAFVRWGASPSFRTWGLIALLVGLTGIGATVVHIGLLLVVRRLRVPEALRALMGRPFGRRKVRSALEELRILQEGGPREVWAAEDADDRGP